MRAAPALFLLLAQPALALRPAGAPITTPSGMEVQWLETVHGAPGHLGLAYRFRFLAPDLARHVPNDPGAGGEDFSGEPWEGAPLAEDLPANETEPPQIAIRGPGIGTRTGSETPMMAEQLAPAVQDMHWLCETYALPRVAAPAPQPAQIVISLADHPVGFGSFDPDALQIFESFVPSQDRRRCLWEPW